MKCKIKNQMFSQALKASGLESVTEIEDSIVDSKQLNIMLDDYSSIVGEEEFSELATEQSRTKEAFKGIRRLKEFGLLMPPGIKSNKVASTTDGFIKAMVTSSTEALHKLQEFLPDGYLVLNAEGSLELKEGVTVEQLNNLIREEFVATELNSNTNYLVVKNGRVKITRHVLNVINNNEYELYLQEIASQATNVANGDEVMDEEYVEETKKIYSGPVISNLNHKKSGIYKRLRILRNRSNPDFSAIGELESEIADITNSINSISKTLTPKRLISSFTKILEGITIALADSGSITDESLAAYMDSLDMIAKTAVYEDNHIIPPRDQSEELMDKIFELAGVGNKLKAKLNSIVVARVQDNVEDRFDMNISKTELTTVYGLASKWAQWFQKVLGIQHIDNPVVQYIHSITEGSIIRANSTARILNDKIEALYKKAIKNKADSNLLYQRTGKGAIAGRMTDVFSHKFWTEKNFKRTTFRDLYAIELDPEILFDQAVGAPERVALEEELVDLMGSYMANKYIDKARDSYSKYNLAKQAMIDSGATASELNTWEDLNSPIKRIEAIRNQDKITNTTDKYLLFVPQKTDGNKDMGYYDTNYVTIMSNPAIMKLYEFTRDTFISNQKKLSNFSEELKPPELGFLNKQVSEFIKEGDFARAKQAVTDELSMKYGKQNLEARKRAVNPATNADQSILSEELHSVSDEIFIRFNALLDEHADELQAIKTAGGPIKTNIRVFKEELRHEARLSVESEMSGDFMQSISMSNYSAQTFIEKSGIEAQIRLAFNLIKLGKIDVDKNASKSSFKSAHEMLFKSVHNYVERRFYGSNNLEQDLVLDLDKRRALDLDPDSVKGEKGTTTRPVAAGTIYATRLIALGWSVPTAMYNFGQAFISNINKGLQGDYFSVSDFLASYRDILKPKNQKIIEMLYIMGDVAFQYEKRDIHSSNKWSKRLSSTYVQTKTEMINQGSVAIAVMKKLKVTDSETGKELSVFEAIDENGVLADKFEGKVNNSDNANVFSGMELMELIVLNKIRPANAQASGDYITPLLLENSSGGKLLMIFKKFLPEMLLDRMGSRRYNYSEQREMEGSISALVDIVWKVRKRADGKLDPADEVRVKRALDGMKEIFLVVGTKIMALLVGRLLCDTKECREQHGAVLFAINYLDKVTDDATGVLAGGVWSFVESPFASLSIITNAATTLGNLAGGAIGLDVSTYKTKGDFNEIGDWKAVQSGLKIIPGIGSYHRAKGMWTKNRQGIFTNLRNIGLQSATSGNAQDNNPMSGM